MSQTAQMQISLRAYEEGALMKDRDFEIGKEPPRRLAILLPLVFLRALGAGDWKLMGAVGALLGPWMVLFVLVASFFVAGFMAIALVLYAKRVRETLENMGDLIKGFFAFGLRANPEISLDNPTLLKLPFGVAAAFGTLICFVAAHWHLGI